MPSSSPPTAAPTVTSNEVVLSNGHTVHFVTHGPPNASQTFFLIHGSAGSHRSFAQLAPLLVQDDFNVVAVDVPGHGSTSGDAAGGDLDLTDARVARAMTETLEKVADRTGCRRFFVLGHSVGGTTAMQVAATANPSGLVRGVALVNSTAFRPTVFEHPRALMHFIVWMLTTSWVTRALVVPFARFVLCTGAGFSSKLRDHEVAFSFQRAGTHDYATVRKTAQRIHASGLPVFMARALDDRVVNKEIGDELCEVLKPETKLEYARGGHSIHKTHADDVAAALLKWAQGIETRKAV
ncbi:Aste57867_9592 [Aphanomyces stellatus]|uniref:Aste57867_9592 protein n=1 Tax=Aphanomyces stellatus TaxID=120398 RepID=A0A485KNC7_9STRA|nr:hypothetical protein As57867_009554 [Aphanomyces stellatus]VFT86471.1 Aste57867_9592 [Aphanomyces stellatus]